MELSFTEEDLAFRDEVRQFLHDNVPLETDPKTKAVEDRHRYGT